MKSIAYNETTENKFMTILENKKYPLGFSMHIITYIYSIGVITIQKVPFFRGNLIKLFGKILYTEKTKDFQDVEHYFTNYEEYKVEIID